MYTFQCDINIKAKKFIHNTRYENSVFVNFVVAKIVNISLNVTSDIRIMQINIDNNYAKKKFQKKTGQVKV